jgi:hypothetical protein
VRERRTDAIDPLANAAVRQSHRGDVGKAASEMDFDLDDASLHADEDRSRGSSEHVIVLAEEAGGTCGPDRG